ncbi:redoxin domain-containing protein [Joostella atrarenae]|uniref:Redoxin domain-containing protein n=1 Tax=Joostella atrarenae TaxID=679257 RepID=A0ABS9IYP4_9FLAO|nr:thioredoxin-like domain-containing protein [Joostella atrarenae]MCF8713298.1 redoxin domain-containing protein [Joostella atrarenae]
MKKLIFLLILIPFLGLAQHSISGTFTPKDQFSKVFLYRVTPNYPTYISNSNIAADGNATVPLESTLETGMYRLVFGVPQDEYYFDFIYNGKEDITFEYSSTGGVTFLTSDENLILQEYNANADEAKHLLSATFEPDVKKSTFFNVFKAIDGIQNQYETQSEGMLANHFIKTGRLPIPQKQISIEEYLSLEKNEFFKHIDFNDPILQNSNYLENASKIYVFRFANKDTPSQYVQNIDYVATKIGTNNELKKSILEGLWYDFSDIDNMEIANYISDTYLEKLAQEFGDKKLVVDINKYKKTGVGAKAPNFNLGNSKSLYDLNDAENYLIIFWSSTCSHCLKEIPEVNKFLENTSSNKLKVIAFGLEESEHPWKDTIKEFPSFTHVYGAGKWENKTSNDYNVVATPTYFLLNADKKIIAKPDSLEELEETINTIQ